MPRWARTDITDTVVIVRPLPGSVRQLCLLCDILIESAFTGRYIEEDPVRELETEQRISVEDN